MLLNVTRSIIIHTRFANICSWHFAATFFFR